VCVCVAVCCSAFNVLQCVCVCCSVLQCSALQQVPSENATVEVAQARLQMPVGEPVLMKFELGLRYVNQIKQICQYGI